MLGRAYFFGMTLVDNGARYADVPLSVRSGRFVVFLRANILARIGSGKNTIGKNISLASFRTGMHGREGEIDQRVTWLEPR